MVLLMMARKQIASFQLPQLLLLFFFLFSLGRNVSKVSISLFSLTTSRYAEDARLSTIEVAVLECSNDFLTELCDVQKAWDLLLLFLPSKRKIVITHEQRKRTRIQRLFRGGLSGIFSNLCDAEGRGVEIDN